MKINTLHYHLIQSIYGFSRTGVMAMATISTLFVTLTILGAFLLFHTNLRFLLSHLEDQLQIQFFLKNSASSDLIRELVDQIKIDPAVRTHNYIPKEEAIQILKKDLGDNGSYLDSLPHNPLPDTIQITLKKTEDIAGFQDRFLKHPAIESTSTGQEWIEKVFKAIRLSEISATMILILLGIANLFIIMNTIRLTVYARRQEIEIMRLVGATNWFIRMPFLIEGILHGLAGSILAVLTLILFYSLAQGQIFYFFPELSLISSFSVLGQLYFKLIFLGVSLGLLGSLFALRKFLV